MSDFNLASQPQINYIKKLVYNNWFDSNNKFYHQVNMNLEPKNLLNGEASELIDELLKDKPDLQYVENALNYALRADYDNQLEEGGYPDHNVENTASDTPNENK